MTLFSLNYKLEKNKKDGWFVTHVIFCPGVLSNEKKEWEKILVKSVIFFRKSKKGNQFNAQSTRMVRE
jgi:hypothetical protein